MLSLIKKISLSVLVISFCGCGKIQSFPTSGEPFVDYEFLPYIQQYKTDKMHYLHSDTVRPMTIVFMSLQAQEGAIGRCWKLGNGGHRIEVDPEWWFSNRDNANRTVLFYHEMGHCDMNYEHNDSSVTIMSPNIMAGFSFAANPDYYLQLFFLERK
jgi:hypothetical protein